MEKRFENALICTSGHVITSHIYKNEIFLVKKYCDCGAPIISACPSCKEKILGCVSLPSRTIYGKPSRIFMPYEKPYHCHACGRPYPWIKEKLNSINNLIKNAQELTEKEKEQFSQSVPDVLSETDKAIPSAIKLHNLIAKLMPLAKEGIKDLLFDITAEAVKKFIWPD